MADVEAIRRGAAQVARAHEENRAAIADERAAAARLIDAVAEAVRPALPALCSAVPRAGWRGLRVVPGRGDLPALYLRQDGSWLLLGGDDPDGPALEVAGETLVNLAGFRADEVARGVAAAIARQLEGKKASQSAAARAAGRQMRALADLLGALRAG